MDTSQRNQMDFFIIHLRDMLSVIDYALQNGKFIPFLTLVYSLIDSLSWTYMLYGEKDNTRENFVAWVDTFLLPSSPLKCTAIDLYAARCGVLHSMTPRARLIREGKARIISYCSGDRSVSELEKVIERQEAEGKVEKGSHLAVSLNDLKTSLETAVNRYREYVFSDWMRFEIFFRQIWNTFSIEEQLP